jgi:hypothetical protein
VRPERLGKLEKLHLIATLSRDPPGCRIVAKQEDPNNTVYDDDDRGDGGDCC